MKKITFKTNYNNKLNCTAFIHIAPAPAASIPESKMNQVFFIATEDNSHAGKNYRLTQFFRIPLNKLGSICTVPSHGIESDQFILNYIKENPAAYLDSEMAVYFYLEANLIENDDTNNKDDP